jgi:hypothetical protein
MLLEIAAVEFSFAAPCAAKLKSFFDQLTDLEM